MRNNYKEGVLLLLRQFLNREYTAPPGTGGGGEGEPAVGDINANGITEVVSAFKSTVNAVIGSTGTLLWAYTTGGRSMEALLLVMLIIMELRT